MSETYHADGTKTRSWENEPYLGDREPELPNDYSGDPTPLAYGKALDRIVMLEAERDLWKREAQSAAVALRALRRLMPNDIATDPQRIEDLPPAERAEYDAWLETLEERTP